MTINVWWTKLNSNAVPAARRPDYPKSPHISQCLFLVPHFFRTAQARCGALRRHTCVFRNVFRPHPFHPLARTKLLDIYRCKQRYAISVSCLFDASCSTWHCNVLDGHHAQHPKRRASFVQHQQHHQQDAGRRQQPAAAGIYTNLILAYFSLF